MIQECPECGCEDLYEQGPFLECSNCGKLIPIKNNDEGDIDEEADD